MRSAFWLSLAGLFYTFVGYYFFVRILSAMRSGRRLKTPHGMQSFVTVLLVVHNESGRILDRLRNLLVSVYPAERLEIIVVADGSTDDDLVLAGQIGDPRIKCLAVPERSGKAFCLNLAIPQACGEIVVFADARQRFATDTVAKLVACFDDPQVGAVSGALEIDPAATASGGGVDLYWRLEKEIRSAEACIDSSIGCTGAVYAIRKALFQPLPPDTILDDVVNPMQIALQGHRVLFEETAVAYDPQTLEPAREKIRKRRTLAGNFQMLFRYPGWLLPWRNRLWWQLISHKYLRLVAPLLLATLFVANAALISTPFFRGLFWGQCVFYGFALAGMLGPSLKFRAFSIPAGFCFLNLMVVAGFWHYLRLPQGGAWATVKH